MPANEALAKAFRFEAAPYFINYPFMSNRPGEALDGNAILYAGNYGLLFRRLFGAYPEAAAQAAAIYEVSKVELGVISRGPHKMPDPQTHDDYVGLATLSLIGDGAVAKEIVEHGRKHWWCYWREGYGVKEKFNGCFWRLPGVVQHLKLCAGESLGILDSLIFSAGVYGSSLGSFKEGSGTILTWHMVSAYIMAGKRNWLCDWAVRKWIAAFNAKEPLGMGRIFGIYFGPNHPFAKWANGVI